MLWRKQGLFIDAPVPVDWALSHAMVPVVERRSDRELRVYFSARDDQGRARIGSADVDMDSGERVFRATPVLDLGPRGSFDDSGVTCSCLVAAGDRLHLFYNGWTLVSRCPLGSS